MKALVVLSHLMSKNCELDNESIERCELAIKLSTKFKYDKIITTGWAYRDDCIIPISDVVKRYLANSTSIDPGKIVAIASSRDTVGDAVFTLQYVIKNNVCELDVVTSNYHANRASLIFKKIINHRIPTKIFGSKTQSIVNNALLDHERNSISAFNKTFSDTDFTSFISIHKTLIEKHPFYNGEIFPKISE